MGLSLTYGGLLYFDRTLGLLTGDVAPAGVELDYKVFPGPADLFRRQCRDAEFAVSEMSMASYLIMRGRGDERFVGLPVFLSRNFRHGQVYVNAKAGISEPSELKGRRVGVFEYQMTAALWIRGFLQHDYGVHPRQMSWFEGGLDVPTGDPRMPIEPPDGVRIERIPADATLEVMLKNGDIDALFSTRPPRTLNRADGAVRRLFPEYLAVERDYFARTGMFPIMHLVVVRRDVYEANRWVASALFDAFVEAKRLGQRRMRATAGLAVALPWLAPALDEIDTLFDGDAFPYGMAANAKVIDAMTAYAHEQGLTSRRIAAHDLFAEETRR